MTDKLLQPPLLEDIRNYLLQVDETKQIFLYVPYIKTKILSKLVKDLKNKIIIITTWHMNDLLSSFASSELELYPFCKENNIALYINNKIHLKVYSAALESAIVATGNISQGGLEGLNEECGVLVNELSGTDRLFLEKIRNKAVYVDEDVYQKYLEKYQKYLDKVPKQIEYEDPIIIPKTDYFLISALPMTRSVDDLIRGYENINSDSKPSEDSETSACIYHDLINYDIEPGLSNDEFLKKLKTQFFSHSFIQRIDEFIPTDTHVKAHPEERHHWTIFKQWVQKNCHDVPIPSLRELDENIRVLYNWFVKLGDGDYVIDIPGAHSERLLRIDHKGNS